MEALQAELEGKIVVTSDHGNALGEFAWPFPLRIYGHPLDVTIPSLVEVPWLESTSDERKAVREESPEEERDPVSEKTNERLRMLGYAE